jgi:polysaccharide pyruvyl transferase WcaK-like protein
MKVAIFTQPLGHNYGGLLQAHALQVFLKSVGCTVVTIDRRGHEKRFLGKMKWVITNCISLLLGNIKSFPFKSRQNYVLKHLHDFRNQQIILSKPFTKNSDIIEYFIKHDYDLIIVGSDQVWRPKYSPCLENFFLDFYDQIGSNAKLISYAASFGVDNWEFNEQQTKFCKTLIKNFDQVTVREDSGVDLCKKYFGVTAKSVVDPTLLLDASYYGKLLPEKDEIGVTGKVLSYVLDPDPNKQKIAIKIANDLSTEIFSIKPKNEYTQVRPSAIDSCQYLKVEHWLQCFNKAGFVVTDSFHGCVFAIIFNKPFFVVGNRGRGLARFESLLSMFDLTDRLVQGVEDLTETKINALIDWKKVNQYRELQSNKGKDFLQSCLS